MAEENQEDPQFHGTSLLPAKCTEFRYESHLLSGENVSLRNISALLDRQLSSDVIGPQQFSNVDAFNQQALLSLIYGTSGYFPKPLPFSGMRSATMNMIYANLHSTFSAYHSQLITYPFNNLPYLTEAPIQKQLPMLSSPTHQCSITEDSSSEFQTQIWGLKSVNKTCRERKQLGLDEECITAVYRRHCENDCRRAQALELNPFGYFDERLYSCKFESCGKTFNRFVSLKSHEQSHISEWPSTSVWKIPKKGKKRPYGLQKYRCTQQEKRPFACKWESCGKTYKRLIHLQRHERTHTGERPFMCNWKSCGKRYMRLEHLRRHEFSHTGERPFICDWKSCEKTYRRLEHLKRHQITHADKLPFICKHRFCRKRYGRLEHLKRHQYTHSKEKKFVCQTCKMRFKSPNGLRKHTKKHNVSSEDKDCMLK